DMQREGPDAPAPPGTRGLPVPGTMLVSPKLRDLLDSDRGALLRERLDARVVGVIGAAGLRGPAELTFYRGTDRLRPPGDAFGAQRVDHFGDGAQAQRLSPLLSLLVAIAVIVLLLPVAVFITAAVRFGGEDRDRRLAALRLVGADRAMAARVAAGETLFGAAVGVAVGGVLFVGLRPLVERVSLADLSFFATDVRPSALLGALIVVAVPVAAVLVSLLALRRVVIEPLGVVRRAADARRRLWWRIIPAVAGLALLLPLRHGLSTSGGSSDEYQAAVGVFFGLVGITAVLPWLVEVVVRRLRGGPLSWQLAMRRLQMDGGTAARVVSGIAVAVAGAIALQTLFTAAERGATNTTGADLSRAQVSVTLSPAPPTLRSDQFVTTLRDTPGVRAASGVARDSAKHRGGPDDAFDVYVGTCSALSEYARLGRCRDGDVFLPPGYHGKQVAKAGDRLVMLGGSRQRREQWTVPADARFVRARPDPRGGPVNAVLVTPGALAESRLSSRTIEAFVRLDPTNPDALDQVRNSGVRLDPRASVSELQTTSQDRTFANVRRGLFAGAVGVLLLIGASLLVGAIEQLRERRRVLAVLVAFGTRRTTLATSVLWQALVPVALGLLVAVVVGASLGALLLSVASQPVILDWATIAAMVGAGGAVVLIVTLLSIPALWRLMRPDGLRTE
ncbi:MAG: hypothetical protein JWO02_3009, partial [Solirubrobacterales bacterium]|nr:hypothetical protein [Solirubrobacterales bacterium]